MRRSSRAATGGDGLRPLGGDSAEVGLDDEVAELPAGDEALNSPVRGADHVRYRGDDLRQALLDSESDLRDLTSALRVSFGMIRSRRRSRPSPATYSQAFGKVWLAETWKV